MNKSMILYLSQEVHIYAKLYSILSLHFRKHYETQFSAHKPNRKNKTHFFIYPKLEQWLIWCLKAADQTQISSNKRHCITKIRSRFVLGRE